VNIQRVLARHTAVRHGGPNGRRSGSPERSRWPGSRHGSSDTPAAEVPAGPPSTRPTASAAYSVGCQTSRPGLRASSRCSAQARL
jgi:hypothetical protein